MPRTPSLDAVLAWHFLPWDRRLRYSDRRRVRTGRTYSVRDPHPLVLCGHGMHGCIHLGEAIPHAPGPVLCRVRMFGELMKGRDKVVARHREVLAMADITVALKEASESLYQYSRTIVGRCRCSPLDGSLENPAHVYARACEAWADVIRSGEDPGPSLRPYVVYNNIVGHFDNLRIAFMNLGHSAFGKPFSDTDIPHPIEVLTDAIARRHPNLMKFNRPNTP